MTRKAYEITSENFPDLVAKVAALLGDSWTVEEIEHPNVYTWIIHPEGYRLYVRRGKRNDKQLRVTAEYLALDLKGQPTGIKPSGVGFTLGLSTILSPESIVSQIKTKILTEYQPSYLQALKSHQEAMDADLKRQAHVEKMAQLLHTTPLSWKPYSISTSLYGASFKSESYCSHNKIELSVPYEVAEELAVWLKERMNAIAK